MSGQATPNVDRFLSVVPRGAALGAEVRGVDLAHPLAAEALRTITEAWQRHLVLLFRGQTLSDEELIAFGRRFGPLHRTEGLAYGGKPEGTAPEIEIVSNQPEDRVPEGAVGELESGVMSMEWALHPLSRTQGAFPLKISLQI